MESKSIGIDVVFCFIHSYETLLEHLHIWNGIEMQNAVLRRALLHKITNDKHLWQK